MEVVKDNECTPGKIGLVNLVNTSFINSVVQCLSATVPLLDYFIKGTYKTEINPRNPLGTRGEIATELAHLLISLWSSSTTSNVNPSKFKSAIIKFAPQFSSLASQYPMDFLAFLLDGIHEDLNRIYAKPYVSLSDDCGKSDEEIAREAWRGYMMRNDSIVVDMFCLQLLNRTCCPLNGKVYNQCDVVNYLTVPIPIKEDSSRSNPGTNPALSLYDCLRQFSSEQSLSLDDSWYCKQCKDFHQTGKRMDIWKVPQILIINLRQTQIHEEVGKQQVNNLIHFPTDNLDLTEFILGPKQIPPIYNLYAVLYGLDHSTASCRHRNDNCWYHYDDSHVPKGVVDVVSQAANILFYCRKDVPWPVFDASLQLLAKEELNKIQQFNG